MATHQHDPNANELWLYFQNVINWVKVVFPNYRREMKGVEWGELYNKYKNILYDAKKLEDEIKSLIYNDDVQSIKGIYLYILTRDESKLNLRQFDDKMKRKVYEMQEGICPICKVKFELNEMEADHILPWHSGGKTILENCQMLCKLDNRTKSGK